RDDRRHGDAAQSWLPGQHLRSRLRSGPIPHADIRPRDGADHGLEAARPDLDPRALGGAQGEEKNRRRHGRSGRGALMSAAAIRKPDEGAPAKWEEDPVLTVEHLTMRFGGLVAINDLSFNVGRGQITAL